MPNTHILDHLVLPVADLKTARARYEMLGFTVAPDGKHPFGTTNCCVYLQDDTFLEPLAIGDSDVVAKSIADGNEFVRGDRDYRRVVGDEGFEAIVLASDDARADHARYLEAGISGGQMLDFSRAAADPSGKADTASFRLAFARDQLSAAPYFFACQRIAVPKVDRAALQRHENGAVGLQEIIFSSPEPFAHKAFLEAYCGGAADARTDCLSLRLANARLTIASPQVLEARLGAKIEPPHGASGMLPVAVVYAVSDVAALERLFKSRAIAYLAHENVLVVQPSGGQGCHFLFEASA